MNSSIFKVILRATWVTGLLSLGACVHMDEDECRAADWRTIGFEDGAEGYSSERIGEHRKACAEYGIAPDLVAWQAGRAEGLREYCVPANGFKVGSQGASYGGVCPSDMEPAFTDAYNNGQHLYSLQRSVWDVSSDLESKTRYLRQAESDLSSRSAAAVSSSVSADERAQAVLDVKELGERVGRLKAEIRQLEDEHIRRQRDLDDYRATLPYSP